MPSVYKCHDNVEDNNVCIGTEIFGRAMSAGTALIRLCNKTEGSYSSFEPTYNERRGPP
jgi:hypothetical protein